jgi:hypothetical protein
LQLSINLVCVSAVSSISVSDVFSATYDNYKILFGCTTTTVGDIDMRFRVSGADNTTSNYGSVNFIARNDTNRNQQVNQSAAKPLSSGTSTTHKVISIDIYDIFSSSKKTKFVGTTAGIGGDVTDTQSGFTGGGFNANTSFTGLTFFVSSGTITGSVSVFGYSL